MIQPIMLEVRRPWYFNVPNLLFSPLFPFLELFVSGNRLLKPLRIFSA